VESVRENERMTLTHDQWRRFEAIFIEHLRAYQIDPMDRESIQQLVELKWRQAAFGRPIRQSDALGLAYSSTTFIETVHDRILRSARTEFLAAEGGAVGADAGASDDRRGGAGSE
jgi:hypothetical protein